jgi:hypothetical protein
VHRSRLSHRLHRSKLLAAGLLVLAPLSACSSTRATTRPLYSSDMVSHAELARTNRLSLYDALRGVHPEFFAPRGRVSVYNMPETSLLVFTKGLFMGDTDVLSWIPVSQVLAVRRLSAVATYNKYGRTTSAGALEIDFRQP